MSGAAASPGSSLFSVQLMSCISWYASKGASIFKNVLQKLEPEYKIASHNILISCESLLVQAQMEAPYATDRDDCGVGASNDTVIGLKPEQLFKDMYVTALKKWDGKKDSLIFILTLSKEDLCALLQILTTASAQRPLVSPIDSHRDVYLPAPSILYPDSSPLLMSSTAGSMLTASQLGSELPASAYAASSSAKRSLGALSSFSAPNTPASLSPALNVK